MGFEVYGDFGLNVYNCVSANQIEHPILSFELTQAQINSIKAEDTGMIVYGYLPLMLTRNCPIKMILAALNVISTESLLTEKVWNFLLYAVIFLVLKCLIVIRFICLTELKK